MLVVLAILGIVLAALTAAVRLRHPHGGRPEQRFQAQQEARLALDCAAARDPLRERGQRDADCRLATVTITLGAYCPTHRRVRPSRSSGAYAGRLDVGGGYVTLPCFASSIDRYGRLARTAHARATTCGVHRRRGRRASKADYLTIGADDLHRCVPCRSRHGIARRALAVELLAGRRLTPVTASGRYTSIRRYRPSEPVRATRVVARTTSSCGTRRERERGAWRSSPSLPGLAIGSFLNVRDVAAARRALGRPSAVGLPVVRGADRAARQHPGALVPPPARALPELPHEDRLAVPRRRAAAARC